MNLKLDLPEEMEAKIRERVASTGQDVESFVLEAVGEKLAEQSVASRARPQSNDWRTKIHKLIDLHPKLSHDVDDSRESIYAGRGE